ncbi:hypothetical protein DSECCO2_301540 [anaerobic digester metagenome]
MVAAAASFYLYPGKNDVFTTGDSTLKVLGTESYGSVVKEGPYGNTDSKVKIAYIVGVHPKEANAHSAITETVKNQSRSLKYCYYIYQVNVTEDADNYNKGRNNGQLLANKYAVPDILKNKFQLAVDVHSNVGNWKENRFIFTPIEKNDSKKIAMNIKAEIPWLTYYVPPNPTSTQYVTLPLINGGVTSVLYETYAHDPYETTLEHAEEFVSVVDGLELE